MAARSLEFSSSNQLDVPQLVPKGSVAVERSLPESDFDIAVLVEPLHRFTSDLMLWRQYQDFISSIPDIDFKIEPRLVVERIERSMFNLQREGEVIMLGSKFFERSLKNCRAVRLQGTSLLDLCNLAAGTFDGLFKVGANYWDFAAGCLILEEAGGKATDTQGDKWTSATINLIATNNMIHDDFLRIFTL